MRLSIPTDDLKSLGSVLSELFPLELTPAELKFRRREFKGNTGCPVTVSAREEVIYELLHLSAPKRRQQCGALCGERLLIFCAWSLRLVVVSSGKSSYTAMSKTAKLTREGLSHLFREVRHLGQREPPRLLRGTVVLSQNASSEVPFQR